MIFDQSPPKRRFLVPEVIQTSGMDCGPATLKCMLEGFGISVSYGRLREACQTNVDGTSIDVMEDVAIQLGLDAEQVMLPADHLLIPDMTVLPAIVITRLPNGLTHFVVAWRLHGAMVQVMDPGSGRIWRTRRHFLSDLYIHTHPVPADQWRVWAGSEGFCDPLRCRMSDAGLEAPDAEQLIDRASADPGWYSIAALDAALRMTELLIRARGLNPGSEAKNVLSSFFTEACENPSSEIIPGASWSVQPVPDSPEEEMLSFKGAVLVCANGRLSSEESDEGAAEGEGPEPLSPELAAALEEEPERPELRILGFLAEDGLLTPAVLILALAMAVFCVTVEAILFRGLIDIGQILSLPGQRIGAVAALFLFMLGMLLLEIPIASVSQRMGRRLETRLRIAFLEKIPRLSDWYFRSRPISDMTFRIHELRGLRSLPGLGISMIRTCFQLLLTGAGVIFVFPDCAGIAVFATLFSATLPFVVQSVIQEQELRLHTHAGGLSRFYLDALLGLIPVRTHCAERAIRREHEGLLVEWVRANKDFLKTNILVGAAEALVGAGFTVWIVFSYVSEGGDSGGLLLLFYWTLNLPVLGRSLAGFVHQYPSHRSRILRVLEPLGAPEALEDEDEAESSPPDPAETSCKGITIELRNLSVQAAGQMILKDIDLGISAGEHIAVVGPSGAGKSSLVGLLLGWYRPVSGQLRVDGLPLGGKKLESLRQDTAWVDPEIQLWNRSLFENLCYGSRDTDLSSLNQAVKSADLFGVLEKLPEGLQTKLGESGRLVSGGEGQRVRLGRAMLRSGVRLVILDEPFRGLDREKRRELLIRARKHWRDATLIFISHDVGEALTFNRVLVIEDGQLAEDDRPENLMENPDSRYRSLMESDEAVRKGLWESTDWRRLWLEHGELTEKK